MTFFSRTARLVLAGFVLGIGACSFSGDTELYGYEDEFKVPEPDLVPVTADDKPGRTVDEMLELTPAPVVVNRETEYGFRRRENANEHSGRFGSKEKVALRKGLNVPEAGIVYGTQKRKNAEEIRPLEIEDVEENKEKRTEEEKILAQIVSPQEEKVEMIEVVPLNPEQNAHEPERLLPMTGRYKEMILAQNRIPDEKQPFETTEENKSREIVLPMTGTENAVQTSAESGADETVKMEPEKTEKSAQAENVKTDVAESSFAEDKTETVSLKQPEIKPEAEENKPAGEIKIARIEAKQAENDAERELEQKLNVMIPLISKPAEPPAARRFVAPEQKEEEEIILLRPPVKKAQSEETEVVSEQEEIFTIYDGFVLVPPPGYREEERIVLKPPASHKAVPSFEIFLDE